MQNQQLAQKSDSLWKLPSIADRAEGEETVTFANSLLLPISKPP